MIQFFKKIFRKIIEKFKWKKNKQENAVMSSSIIVVNDKEKENKETSVLDVDLLDDNASKADKKKVRQYTKILITALTVCACVWISCSYVLATVALIMYGNTELLSTLSEKVCEVILGVTISYSLKAFFETFSQKGMELIDNNLNKKLDKAADHVDVVAENEEAVG